MSTERRIDEQRPSQSWDHRPLRTRMKSTAAFMQLPPLGRWVVFANGCNSLGSGLVLPLLVIYLTRIVHLHLALATGVLSIVSLGALAGNPMAGWIADQRGRLWSLTVHIGITTAAVLLLAATSEAAMAVSAALLMGLGVGGTTAWSTILAEAVPAEERPAAFGINYVATNVGIAVGAAVGGVVASTSHPWTFRCLYIVDALSFLLALAIIVIAHRVHSPEPHRSSDASGRHHPDSEAEPTPASYRSVLGNRTLVWMSVLGLFLFLGGYSQVESGLIALLTSRSKLGAGAIGIAFAVNTTALVVMHEARARRKSRPDPSQMLNRIGLAWAAAWLLFYAASAVPGGGTGFALLCAGMIMFALGETYYAAAVAATINSVTSDRTRGRANALYNFGTSLGFVVGPALAGVLVHVRGGQVFVAAAVTACVVSSIVGSRIPKVTQRAMPVVVSSH